MTMEELAAALRSISDNVAAIADGLVPESQEIEETDAPAQKEEENAIRLEDVRAVLSDISRSGHTAEMKSLLARHGAKKLSEVDPADYAQLLAEAKEIKDA